jgi:hypothetical protein
LEKKIEIKSIEEKKQQFEHKKSLEEQKEVELTTIRLIEAKISKLEEVIWLWFCLFLIFN